MIRLKNLLVEGEGKITGQYIEKGKSLANSLISRGFSKIEAAAIVGNMWAESTFEPTAKGPSGDYGLIQWLGPRKEALENFAKKQKSKMSSLTTQLDFLKFELLDSYNGEYKYETHQFNKAMAYGSTAADKAEGFAIHSERPLASALSKSLPTRRMAAQQVYDLLTNKNTQTTKSTTTSSKTGGAVSTGIKKSSTNKTYYTVKQGDSLSVIAQKYNTTVDVIMKLNPAIKSKDSIRPGQKILIIKY